MATYVMYELKDGKFCTKRFTELNVFKKKTQKSVQDLCSKVLSYSTL